MTYYQLFKLEDFLNANEEQVIHLELEEETSYEQAFGDLGSPWLNECKAKGLYIVVFPEDAKDMANIYDGILNYCKDIEYNFTLSMGVDRDGIYKIVIGVDETK